MPPIRNTTHRIQRYFPPLVVRTAFRAERLLTPPPMVSNTLFPHEEYGIIPHIKNYAQGSDGHNRDSCAPIPKPNGKVTRLSRQGYNLSDALGWKSDMFNEIQVGFVFRAW